MERKRFIISGRVQRVGYRDLVSETARELKVAGTVRNLEDEFSVEAVAEGTPAQLAEFEKRIRSARRPVDVEGIISFAEKAEGLRNFRILRGEAGQELGERMDEAVGTLHRMDNKLDGLGAKSDTLASKSDTLAEKSDKIAENINALGAKSDTLAEKSDVLAQKSDSISSEVRSMSSNVSGRFDKLDEKYVKVSTLLERIAMSLESSPFAGFGRHSKS